MLKKLYLLGIGPGDPKYLTQEAKELIERLSLFLVPQKVGAKEELTEKRTSLLKRIKGSTHYEIIYLPFPEREKGSNYRESVKEWRLKKAQILKNALLKIDTEEAGFLIWGDPTIYDGHIDILKIIESELTIEWEVIPGLSSFQVLAAKGKLSLTELSTPLSFHTPRTLRKLKHIEHPVVVFLDNYETFNLFKKEPLQILWGAYVGTEDEVYVKGPLIDKAEEIKKARKNYKEKKGYLMEIYLLKPQNE